MTLNEKYGFTVEEDQLGNPVPPNYQDEKEAILLHWFEKIALERGLYSMVELGSNWAYYTLLFASIRRHLGEPCKITCVESDPDNFLRTFKHIANSQFVACDVDGKLATVGQEPGVDSFNGRQTDCIRLDETFACDILHCDIDGGEAGLLDFDPEYFSGGMAKYIFLLTHKDAVVNGDHVSTHQFCKSAFKHFPYDLIHEDGSWSIGGDSLLIYKRK